MVLAAHVLRYAKGIEIPSQAIQMAAERHTEERCVPSSALAEQLERAGHRVEHAGIRAEPVERAARCVAHWPE